jgi:hypothetical protein
MEGFFMRGRMADMARFPMKDIWPALILLALGLSMLALLFQPHYFGQPQPSDLADSLMWIMAGVLIGAGIMMPLGHPFISAGIGFIVQCILLCLFIMRIAAALNGI